MSGNEFRSRLAGAVVAGALLSGLAAVAAAFLLRPASPEASHQLSRFLAGGGGLALVLWGAGAGALVALRWARARRDALEVAVAAGAALALGWAAAGPAQIGSETPAQSARAKVREIRRSAYRDAASVGRILRYARDPDPRVREHAALALGVNLVVDDVQKATPQRPARRGGDPLLGRMRDALLAGLSDSVEAVRAEAARALWKAPRAYGSQLAAAETLAAVLDRALVPGQPERLAWLALDAAAGASHPRLEAAAARFAAATPDQDLAEAARRAIAR